MKPLVLIVRQVDRDFVESFQECKNIYEAEIALNVLRDKAATDKKLNPAIMVQWENHPDHKVLDTVLRINQYRYWIVQVNPI